MQKYDAGHVERQNDEANRADDQVEPVAARARVVRVSCDVRPRDQNEPVDVGEHDDPGGELRQYVDRRGEELARERRVRG